MEAPMSEMGMTVLLVIAVLAFGWLVYRVVSGLGAGGETASRADANAAGAIPGSEQIDDSAKARAIIRHNRSAI